MLDEMPDQRRRRFGHVHVQRLGLGRDRHAEQRGQGARARAGGENGLSAADRGARPGPVLHIGLQAGVLARKRDDAGRIKPLYTEALELRVHSGIRLQRVELAFVEADLGAEDRLAEVGRHPAQFRPVQHVGVEPEFSLPPAFAGEEGELRLVLRHHQTAGLLDLHVCAEFGREFPPTRCARRIERQRALQVGHELWIHADEAALQLYMQAAGIGGGSGMGPIVDDGDTLPSRARDSAAHMPTMPPPTTRTSTSSGWLTPEARRRGLRCGAA